MLSISRFVHYQAILTLGCTFVLDACSLKSIALKSVAQVFSEAGDSYGQDDQPELIKRAAPFALKTMEQLAEALPKDTAIRLALAHSFTQYTYAFFQPEADFLEDNDFNKSQLEKEKTKRLYLRARNYALDSLDLIYPGSKLAFLSGNQENRQMFLQKMKKKDVPVLYWLGASWGLAISNGRGEASLIGDLGIVDEIMQRALELEEAYEQGALYEFYISFTDIRTPADRQKVEFYKQKAEQLSQGYHLSLFVAYAENALVHDHNKAEFVNLLNGVLKADVYVEQKEWKKNRMQNILAQQRANWLLTRLETLFADS